jgi:hypothetical protein
MGQFQQQPQMAPQCPVCSKRLRFTQIASVNCWICPAQHPEADDPFITDFMTLFKDKPDMLAHIHAALGRRLLEVSTSDATTAFQPGWTGALMSVDRSQRERQEQAKKSDPSPTERLPTWTGDLPDTTTNDTWLVEARPRHRRSFSLWAWFRRGR